LTVIDRLNSGCPVYGITATIPDPFVAEILAAQPFDYIMVDTEHSPMSAYQLQTQLIALRTSSASVLVRVAESAPSIVGAVLDLGADGVVTPHIDTPADCERVVRAALYPPRGHRGIGPRRAARLQGRDHYFAHANDTVAVWVMIESSCGVQNIDDIIAVEGLGGVIIGAADLSASLGHLNDAGHRDVTSAIDLIARRCSAAGMPFGMYARSPAEAETLLSQGARIISIGSDLMFFDNGIHAALNAFAAVRQSHTQPSSPAQHA
jgi:2-dehydro-3-deoxy-L-rhamnonate aldolase